MPATQISKSDLAPFATIADATAEAMVADAVGMAKLFAPCIFEEEFAHPDAAKAVIRGAILRWHDSKSGAITTNQAGPFQQTIDSNTRRNGMFWPSEIEQLQKMCAGDSTAAFAIDTLGSPTLVGHADVCSLVFGALFCSCGADLTGSDPLWESEP